MEEDEPAIEIPQEITPEVFHQWRDARRGERMAEELSNPYWSWLATLEDEFNSYRVNKHFSGPSSIDGNPLWSWDRFGRSETLLPDGTTVFVAGEHEDFYDPDFFIYNDVVIRAADGDVRILGYPTEVFPPTDFHSATLWNGQLLLVGNLGYGDERLAGETQILLVDVRTWEVCRKGSTGDGPGWIHEHNAELVDGGEALLITGGKVWTSAEDPIAENIDEWQLDLREWRWKRLTERCWPAFAFSQSDGASLDLFGMRCALWNEQLNLKIESATPPKDREAFENLYRPSVAHRAMPENEDEHNVFRIEIEGVTVRYVEEYEELMMTVEGTLPNEMVEGLRDDLLGKLQRATGKKLDVGRMR